MPLKALLSFYVYMHDAIDLRPEDKFWNIADPGWAYGLYYAVAGPLLMGHATTFYDGPFTADSTYRLVKERGITNLAGSPTAFRLLIAAGPEAAAAVKGQLRAVASAGEPLNPEVIRWFAEHLAAPIHDQYGQTELGMVVNNHHRLRHPVHPGSAGFAMPGYRVAVLDDAGKELAPNVPGELAIDIGKSPLLWFHGYYQAPTPAISGGYYRTGDTVELEPNGSISFVGRADDVITSSGYRIGPFDVESALIEHPSVVEAAVVGKPDPGADGNREGFRRAETGLRAYPRLNGRAAAICEAAALGTCLSPRDRVRGGAPQNAKRQGPEVYPARQGALSAVSRPFAPHVGAGPCWTESVKRNHFATVLLTHLARVSRKPAAPSILKQFSRNPLRNR